MTNKSTFMRIYSKAVIVIISGAKNEIELKKELLQH